MKPKLTLVGLLSRKYVKAFDHLLRTLFLTICSFSLSLPLTPSFVLRTSEQPSWSINKMFQDDQVLRNNTELLHLTVNGYLHYTHNISLGGDTGVSINTRQLDSEDRTTTRSEYLNAGTIFSFDININECADAKVFTFPGVTGEIYVTSGGRNRSRIITECSWTVRGPEGYQALSSVSFRLYPCLIDITVTVISDMEYCKKTVVSCKSKMIYRSLVLSFSNQHHFLFSDSLQDPSRSIEFILQFQAVPSTERILHSLPITFTSPTSGYVTSYGFEKGFVFPCGTNATRLIIAPEGHVIMISLAAVYTNVYSLSYKGAPVLKMYKVSDDGSLTVLGIVNGQDNGPTFIQTNILLHLEHRLPYTITGFKMHFSFHPISETPRRLNSGLWDCSVPNYSTFKRHLECNLDPECQGGEDEGPHCGFSSPACNGSVAVGDKCYENVQTFEVVSARSSENECRKRGGHLATMKSREEWEAFLKIFQYGKRRIMAMIGLRTSKTDWPKYYKYALMWADGTVSYETNTTQDFFIGQSRAVCGFYQFSMPLRSVLLECVTPIITSFICEYRIKPQILMKQKQVVYPTFDNPMMLWRNRSNVSVVQCARGHVTHSFLSCDPNSYCRASATAPLCRTIISEDAEMFRCDDQVTLLPYTLVCDFRSDCLDESDEKFCKHEHKCQEFSCRNGQCIPNKNYCDLYKDCWDGSDEDCSSIFFYDYPPKQRLFAPAVVYFDGAGEFYQVPMAPSEPCPQTHFRCAGESAYCLPVYVRCNGVYDCPSHEDEEDCQQYTCPGFYRCRGSSVCVHGDNVCDGWPQCPQHDDEKFCGLRCPDACVCQGLAFVCKRSFTAKNYLEMRFLDATGSGMTVNDVQFNTYLIWLCLSSCSLTTIFDIELPNLQVLDFSYNELLTVDLSSFRLLQNLKVLRLAGNPLATLTNEGFSPYHINLQALDLSTCLLNTFDSKVFLEFPNINLLNISFNNIETITENRFNYLPRLSQVDARKNSLGVFPREVLTAARYLSAVYVDNYKFCCQTNLPESFGLESCFAPQDEISSCDDLLRSDVYRIFLWLFCVLSISGNVGSFLFQQLHKRRHSVSGFVVFVTNLSVSDFLMGVYLAIIGGADETYRSIYLWNDVQWKVSTTCKVAGFLSLMSSEVSALIICLITLDRFIVLRFPFSKFHFERWSASWACGLAWTVGFTLAAVPFLPFLSDWEFYSQNGICIPLPITRKSFGGRRYSFGVMIIFNMILFMVIAVGQICIYWSVRVNSMKESTTKKSKDIIIARRLATVVVSDFLCWFPIGLVSIMAASGIAVPDEFSIVMIIFVLPLNASLNPFLYTFNLVLEKWKQAEEARMLRRLEARQSWNVYKSTDVSTSDSGVSSVS